MSVDVLLHACICTTQHQHDYIPLRVPPYGCSGHWLLHHSSLLLPMSCIYSTPLHWHGLTSPLITIVSFHVLVCNVLIHPSAQTILKLYKSWMHLLVCFQVRDHYCYVYRIHTKTSRHVNFEDVTNLAFLQFYFQGSSSILRSILLSDWCKSKFANDFLRIKILRMASWPWKPQKLHPLKICMHTVYQKIV